MPRSKLGVKRTHVIVKALEQSITDVLSNKETIGQAAKKYHISKSTLFHHLELHRKSGNETFSYHSNIAHKRILTNEEELSLVDYLATAAKLHYGLWKAETMKLVFRFAMANEKNVPLSWIKNEAAGKDFMIGFLKRHPVLSLRKPEATSISRSTSFNRSNVTNFFNNLRDCISRFEFDASRIYNLDETGNSTVHIPQIGSMTSGERGINVTLIGAVNAIGNHVPPMLIFPRVHFKEHILIDAPIGCVGGANPSEKKVLLIMDNHETHISLSAINLARKYGVVLLTLPPHTSHKMQPLDRTVFGPYKMYYNKAASEWMLNNPGKPMTIYNVAQIVGKAYPKAFNQQNIVKGFEVTGIFPFNEIVFNDDEFLSSYVTDRPYSGEAITESNEKPNDIYSVDKSLPSTSQMLPSFPKFVPPEQIRPFPKAAPCKQNITKLEVVASTSKQEKAKKKVLAESSDDDDIMTLPITPRTSIRRQVKDNKKPMQLNSSEADFSGDEDMTVEEIFKLAKAKHF